MILQDAANAPACAIGGNRPAQALIDSIEHIDKVKSMPGTTYQSLILTGVNQLDNYNTSDEIPSYACPNYSQVKVDNQGSFVPPEICSVFHATQLLYVLFYGMEPEEWREILEEGPSPKGIGSPSIEKGYGPLDASVEGCVYRMTLGRERLCSVPVDDYRESDGKLCGVPVVHITTEQNDNAEALNAWENCVSLDRFNGGYSATFPFLETLIKITGRREGEVFGKFKKRLAEYTERLLTEEPILI